jgi:predicted transcriptional regulator
MAIKDKKKLTELELEVMKAVWDLGETTIGEVGLKLQASSKKKHAYTTIATMMKILEKKKFLKSKKVEKAHKYAPLVTMDVYEKSATDHFIDKVLGGKPRLLVMRLLDNENINKEELKEIKKSLDARIKG